MKVKSESEITQSYRTLSDPMDCSPPGYSVIKKNEIMPFAATWMDLEIITLSEVRKRQISYDIIYMQSLRKNTNEQISKTERHT